MLLCTVRGCAQPLTRDGGSLSCPRGHSFDVARRGYINLLQPQDRRSKEPGDSAAGIAARRRLHDQGVTAPFVQAIAELLRLTASDTVLDAGCGDGFYLGTLAQSIGLAGHGVDISLPAIDSAARRYPACQWVVANADRFLPWADASFSAVVSITARMNAPEFRRVLRPGGRLLVAIPAPDDLIELRGPARDRVPRTVESFAGPFTLTTHRRVTTRATLAPADVADVLLSTYRRRRDQPAEPTAVTFSLDLLLFRPA